VLFGGEHFDDSIDSVKAKVLIHAIKSSPGGWKLSMEVTLWLAVTFEDAYLPGEADAMRELIHDAAHHYEKIKQAAQWTEAGELYLVAPIEPAAEQMLMFPEEEKKPKQ
jgi:hypothetical protein